MHTLLLRLAAPLQAWGSGSKFSRRTTNREPTKSGVIGLVAAALGYGRNDSPEELSHLDFAVRIDQPGRIVKDFHTAHTFGEKKQTSFISDRYYLSDAIFLVGLAGPRDLLERIEDALRNPVFPIALGRRSCPPAQPLVLRIAPKSLRDALCEEAWQAADWYRKRQPGPVYLEIVRDAAFGEAGAFEAKDLPLSFSQAYRRYAFRNVVSDPRAVLTESDGSVRRARANETHKDGQAQTEHDAFGELEAQDVSIED